MPTVPRAQRTVESVAMPNTYAPSPSIIQSPDFVTPTNKVFATAEKIMQEEVKKVNQVALLDADTQLSKHKTRIALDVDNLKGKNAVRAPEHATKELDAQAAIIEKGLGNEDQRRAFNASYQSYKSELDGHAQRHAAAELRNYDIQTAQASKSNSIEEAAAKYGDPAYVEGMRLKMHAAGSDLATRNGYSPEQIKAQKADDEERFDVAQINRMHADGNDLAARDYFNEHSASIRDPAIRKRVAVASSDGEGLRASSDTWAQIGPKVPSDPVNSYDMKQKLRVLLKDNPDAYKAAEIDIDERTSAWNAQVTSNRNANMASVSKAFANNEPFSKIKNSPEYMALDGVGQNSFKDYAIAKAKAASADGVDRTTPAQDMEYVKRLRNVATMSDDAIWASVPVIGQKNANKLYEAKTKSLDATENLTQMTTLQAIDNRLDAMGVAKEGKQGQARAAFTIGVYERIHLLEKTTLGGKRKANHEEVTDIINELSMKNLMFTIEQGWLGLEKEVPSGEVPSDTAIEGVRYAPSKQAGSINLKVGDTKNGYRYKGGDPSKKENWTKL